jgi:hypothetical protein
LFLVRLRFVPASRCALGREIDHGAMANAEVNQALMNGGVAMKALLRLPLCLASSTQCETDE